MAIPTGIDAQFTYVARGRALYRIAKPNTSPPGIWPGRWDKPVSEWVLDMAWMEDWLEGRDDPDGPTATEVEMLFPGSTTD